MDKAASQEFRDSSSETQPFLNHEPCEVKGRLQRKRNWRFLILNIGFLLLNTSLLMINYVNKGPIVQEVPKAQLPYAGQ